MGSLLKWLLILIISMLGAFITYKLYNFSSEWGFIVAFLGGAVTLNIAASIKGKIES